MLPVFRFISTKLYKLEICWSYLELLPSRPMILVKKLAAGVQRKMDLPQHPSPSKGL